MEEKDKETKQKKENSFSKLWNKTKKAVNDSVLENKIQSTFNKKNDDFTLYTRNELLSKSLCGYLANDELTIYGELDVKKYSVVISDNTEKAYYVIDTQSTELTIDLDGVFYKRAGTILKLDSNVEEVKVVKAGKKYYVYKGE